MSKSRTQTADARIEELLLDLPIPSVPRAPQVSVREAGKLCVVGPAYPFSDGRIAHKGRLGLDVRLEQGQQAARIAAVQLLAMVKAQFGTLNTVKQCVSLRAAITAGPDFVDHHKVPETASALLESVFGPAAAQHTVAVTGAVSLPHAACVALELWFMQ